MTDPVAPLSELPTTDDLSGFIPRAGMPDALGLALMALMQVGPHADHAGTCPIASDVARVIYGPRPDATRAAPVAEVERLREAGKQLSRSYRDGEVTMASDAFDDFLEAAYALARLAAPR